jgi:selenocysteine lyase/cysteine desulfurase
LVERLWHGLSGISRVRVFGLPPSQPRTPTISFALAGIPAVEVAARLAQRGVFVSHGDFYASTAVERLGFARDGLVRVGCACYSSEDEIDRLLVGLREIAC